MKFFRPLLVSIGILFAYLNVAFGAEFLAKQSGTTTIANGSSSNTVVITAVDMSKSFLVFSSTVDNNATTNFQIGGEVTNSTTLTFARTGNTGTVSISWQVFEFESGVYVQHGSSTSVARGAPVNVAINCIDLAKSFVLITARKSGGQFGADDGVSANLTTSTNLQLMISNNGPGGADMEEAYWQVIEYQGAIVKKLTTTLSAGSASTTSTISPAIGTLSKAFVVSNHWLEGDVNSDDLPRTELTNTTTVTYTRVGTTVNMNFVTYVIEFTDGSTVTRGTQNFGSGVTTQPVLIAATSASGVIAPGNFGRQGSTNFATDDNIGHNWFTYEITSGTNLQITRAAGTGSTADAPWQIVTFEDTNSGLQTSTFYSIGSGDWEDSANWSYTPDGSSGAVPIGVYPRRINNVVIQNGDAIIINSVTDNEPCSQSPQGLGRPNVAAATPTGPFTGAADQMFYHTGDLMIATGATLTSSEEVMLEGYTRLESGSTFTITEDIVNLGYMEIAATANFDNTDDLILSGNSVTIMNNTSTSDDDLYIDDTDATLCGEGVMNIGTGGPDPTIQYWNGATIAQVCAGFTVSCGPPAGPCPGGFPMSGTGDFSSGNSGPGGVGTNTGTSSLKLWFRVDNGVNTSGASVDSWTNSAGITALDISEVTTQRPSLVAGALNGFAEVSFNGTNRLRTGLTLTTSNFVNDRASSFAVVRADNTGQTSSVYLTDPLVGNRFSNHIPWSNVVYYDIGDCCGNDARLDVAGLTGLTNYSIWTYDADPGSGKQLYRNGSLLLSRALTSTFTGHATSRFNLGANTTGSNGFQGDVTEVIIFNAKVNTAQRIIIDNYLSAKYDLALSANDLYAMDDVGNGNYDFDMAGLGQAADGTNHIDARGTGIVRVWNPNALDDNDFLMWGHDNGGLTNSADVDGTVIEERLTRIWRISETADVGTVSISFDLNGVGNPLGSNLRLLIDRDNDFTTNDVTPIVGTVSGNVAVFSGVNFLDGDRFTLGNTDNSSPLPVELYNFAASIWGSQALINWTTSSELNNDFFAIQKSTNAEQWEELAVIKGAGTSKKQLYYEVIDSWPFAGISYYRLKQTDFDGKFTYSKIVSVRFEGINEYIVSPNPSTGLFTVGGRLEPNQMRLFNALGQAMQMKSKVDGQDTQIDISSHPAGIYILQVSNGLAIRVIRLLKN